MKKKQRNWRTAPSWALKVQCAQLHLGYNYPINYPATNMAAGNCHAKFKWG